MKVFVLIIAALATAASASNDAADSDENDKLEIINPKDNVLFPKVVSRITNGYSAYNGKAPYIVGLDFRRGNSGSLCGGSIIDHNWVLTAAHCTNNAERVIIRYGSNLRNRPAYTHEVGRSNIIQHRNFPRINGNDIALIKTPHVDYSQTVNRVMLPSFKDRNNKYANSWAVACGFGNTYDNSPTPDLLQCVDLEIISNNVCRRYYNINDGMLCVSTPNGKSTCSGDSGGPLVTHNGNILVGVTSFGSVAGCQSGRPSGFTRVTRHLDWIRDNTGIAY